MDTMGSTDITFEKHCMNVVRSRLYMGAVRYNECSDTFMHSVISSNRHELC